MAKEKLFYIGVKGLIENGEGQILLLQADVTAHRNVSEPYWDIPGGRIEVGASAVETLKREIEEETKINDVQNIEFYYAVISNHQIPLDDSKTAGLALMIYKVKVPADSEIVISDEHIAYEWVEHTDAAKRLSNKYPKEFTDLLK